MLVSDLPRIYLKHGDIILKKLSSDEELHPLVAPSGSGIEVVANAHLGSGGVQNVCAVAVGSHPRVEHFLSRSFAPADVLAFALAGLLDAILTQNGEAVGAIGAGVGSGLCNFLCALLSGCVLDDDFDESAEIEDIVFGQMMIQIAKKCSPKTRNLMLKICRNIAEVEKR